MAFPSAPAPLWIAGLMTLALAVVVHSNVVFDEDPLQPVTTDEMVSVGGTVTLTCRVADNDNSSLQWSNTAQQTLYFGEKRALRDNRIQLHRSTSTELSITIAEVQLSDEGDYTCSIFTMPVRTARATVTVLGVPGKPHISGLENPVQEGGTVTLTCTSTGSKPPARLHWFRGDEELEGRPDVVESVQDEPTYNVSSELTLEVSRANDNQVITCAVDHPSLAPGDKRSEHTLRVLYSPNVQILPESDLPREGEKFLLQCLGNSNPEPSSYTWEKKDGELPPLAKADGAFLRFETLNKSDNGVYLCFVDNGVGSSAGEYTLLVQDPDTTIASATSSPTSPPSSPFATESTSSFDITELSSTIVQSESTATVQSESTATVQSESTATLSNELFPDITLSPDSSSSPSSLTSVSHTSASSTSFSSSFSTLPSISASAAPSSTAHSSAFTASSYSSVSDSQNGRFTSTAADNAPDPTAMSTSSGVDHAVIGGVVAVIVFILLCLLIVFGRYLIRHKGTYLTHEAKGSDDAPDADTAIINAEGGHSGAEDKKEYFI
ncbi:cell adhesion molecule 3 isoform X2 [Nerophis lumbriciformis]|uniref:cell adhesion molecule 3 isoform X2 n=1 Tax=Nerophis lumbriciformis TaxID=546530 RepID=UPI002ADF4929|nr:cell adhesion molecule 3-like isoform X2 [Nerophis lumbriciformis]